MSNYPLGAENDPRAPYNDNGEDVLENVVEQSVITALNEMDSIILDQLFDVVKEAVEENTPYGEWEDVVADRKDDIIDAVFDQVRDRYRRIFE